jgi:hypothetical protein
MKKSLSLLDGSKRTTKRNLQTRLNPKKIIGTPNQPMNENVPKKFLFRIGATQRNFPQKPQK